MIRALILGLIVAGCGGSSGSAVSVPMCKRSSTLEDGGAGACHAAAALVDCTMPNGVQCGCISDTLSCAMCDSSSGYTCKNTCGANEYALACGGIGPSSAPYTVPTECHSGDPTPAGIVFYCCPCL